MPTRTKTNRQTDGHTHARTNKQSQATNQLTHSLLSNSPTHSVTKTKKPAKNARLRCCAFRFAESFDRSRRAAAVEEDEAEAEEGDSDNSLPPTASIAARFSATPSSVNSVESKLDAEDEEEEEAVWRELEEEEEEVDDNWSCSSCSCSAAAAAADNSCIPPPPLPAGPDSAWLAALVNATSLSEATAVGMIGGNGRPLKPSPRPSTLACMAAVAAGLNVGGCPGKDRSGPVGPFVLNAARGESKAVNGRGGGHGAG